MFRRLRERWRRWRWKRDLEVATRVMVAIHKPKTVSEMLKLFFPNRFD